MYYPPRIGTTKQLRALYPHNEIIDDDEEDWLEHLQVGRSRGKGAPKKKRTAAGMLTCLRGRVIVLMKDRVEEVQQAEVDETTLDIEAPSRHFTHHVWDCMYTVNGAFDGVICICQSPA